MKVSLTPWHAFLRDDGFVVIENSEGLIGTVGHSLDNKDQRIVDAVFIVDCANILQSVEHPKDFMLAAIEMSRIEQSAGFEEKLNSALIAMRKAVGG